MHWEMTATGKMLTKCTGAGAEVEPKQRSLEVRKSKHGHGKPTVVLRDVRNVKVGGKK